MSSEETEHSSVLRSLSPFIIIAVVIVLVLLLNSKEKLTDVPTVVNSVHEVKVATVRPQSLTLDVETTGVVTAKKVARISPEVAGKIIWVSDRWEDGGFFRKGDVMLRIESYQYENQVAKAKAQLAESEARFVQEQGMAQVAQKEWEQRRNKSATAAAKSLALREPQYNSAKAQYESSKSDLDLAEISLDKTEVIAPFDGILLKKTADLGQFISTSQVLGELYSVDAAEVRVPLTESNQYLINLPTLLESGDTPVEVTFKDKGGQEVYEAKFVRTESVLDEVTKVLYGVVEVDDPYRIKTNGKKPLRIGSYVTVHIPGREISDLYLLPEAVLRGANRVYVLDEDDILRSKVVELQSNYDGLTVVSSGLSGDERVVIGRVGEAMEGRKVISKAVKLDFSEPAAKE